MDFGLGSWCSFLLWGLMGRSCTRFAFVLWGCYFWQIFLSGVGKTSCFYVNYVGIVGIHHKLVDTTGASTHCGGGVG